MAFDYKQLRTCKELMKLLKIPSYISRMQHHTLANAIFVRFGRFYVTNSYVLVCIEWNEYQHAGDEEWQKVSRFMDNDGKLVPFEFETCERQFSNDFFERFFIDKVDYSEHLPVNAHLLRDVLNVFQINGINPIMEHDGSKWELSGHNNDVSIKAIVMGTR